MAAKPNNSSAASSDAVTISSIPADDIAEAIAAQAPKVEKLAGGDTIRRTNIEYIDRTGNPVDDVAKEYELSEQELAGGTLLRTFGDPVGGFPAASN
jgi:hypothetical protein